MDDTTPTNLIPFPASPPRPWAQPPVLRTERAADFDELLAVFERDVAPRNAIEQMYVRDVAVLVWEMVRLRRAKTALIDAEYPTAIRALVRDATFAAVEEGRPFDGRACARELAGKWRSDESGRQEVFERLHDLDLDPSDLEAAVIRNLASSLEPVDRMLLALQLRRDRALASIADYRTGFVRQVRDAAERLAEAEALGLAPPPPDDEQ